MPNNVPPDSVPPSGSGSSQPAQGPSPAPSGAAGAPAKPYYSSMSGGGGKSLSWLGMNFTPEQTKQLNNIMIQNINNQIQAYNDKGVKAIKNYEKVSEGQDPDL